MRNAECTPITPEEGKNLFAAFPRYLRDEEEALARKFFEQYVFFETVDRNTRWCVCTGCMEGFLTDKAIRPDFFKVKHRGACECPNCGERATLLAMGKYTNFQELRTRVRAVQVSTCKDWLLVQAGYVSRSFRHDDLGGDIEFEPFRRYAFAPGRRVGWKTKTYSWFGREWYPDGLWERMERIQAPFQNKAYERDAAYWPLGLENIAGSSMRYCQYSKWFDQEYGGLADGPDFDMAPFRIAHLTRYLAEYTRHPQIEFLVKLEFYQVVSDLVLNGKPHRSILNWDAGNPADFFRMSKADFRLFKGSPVNFEELKNFHDLRRKNLAGSLEEFFRLREELGNGFRTALRGAELAGVSLGWAARYLRSFSAIGTAVAAQLWADYLNAAAKLRYDLSRDAVRMPKDLAERHDHATAAVLIEADEAAAKRYRVRLRQLTEQFSFSAQGLCVVIPNGVQDIVREGRILSHCVGGYADRHMDGRATILFLRKESAPSVPYVTIEMSTENNCRDLKIRQIHGYRNERDGTASPLNAHADFLKLWLDWVHAGSPRDRDGQPVIAEETPTA